MDEEEVWAEIVNFSDYLISNLARVFWKSRNRLVPTSLNQYGYVKVSIHGDDGFRHTCSVAIMVGEAFVERPDRRCNNIIVLNGDLANVCHSNLAWRPSGFARRYFRQLRIPQHQYFHNLPVRDLTHNRDYDSIIEAGIAQGQMFEDIWRSTYTGAAIFPYRSVYKVTGV